MCNVYGFISTDTWIRLGDVWIVTTTYMYAKTYDKLNTNHKKRASEFYRVITIISFKMAHWWLCPIWTFGIVCQIDVFFVFKLNTTLSNMQLPMHCCFIIVVVRICLNVFWELYMVCVACGHGRFFLHRII